MAGIRKRHSQHIKVKVVLEAMKGQLTTAELTSKYGVHASQIMTWKKRALAVLPEAFSPVRKRSDTEQQALIDELYKQIGQLTVERDWLKKTSARFSGEEAPVARPRGEGVEPSSAMPLTGRELVKPAVSAERGK